jgi:hypothetical protein
MTVRSARLPYDFIDTVSNRIMSEISKVSRVVGVGRTRNVLDIVNERGKSYQAEMLRCVDILNAKAGKTAMVEFRKNLIQEIGLIGSVLTALSCLIYPNKTSRFNPSKVKHETFRSSS